MNKSHKFTSSSALKLDALEVGGYPYSKTGFFLSTKATFVGFWQADEKKLTSIGLRKDISSRTSEPRRPPCLEVVMSQLVSELNMIDRILIPSRYTFFFGSPIVKNSRVKLFGL
jgi:hypothetical protein